MSSREFVVPAKALQRPEAVLVLRLGMASNAITAAQQFTQLAGNMDDSQVKQLLMLHSFQLAISYLKEASFLIEKNLEAIRKLVEPRNEIDPACLERCEKLAAKTDPVNKVLAQVRDQVTFHWDKDIVEGWIAQQTEDEINWTTIGAQPVGVVHVASLDVVGKHLLSTQPKQGDDDTEEQRFRRLVDDVLAALDCVGQVFNAATITFILESEEAQ